MNVQKILQLRKREEKTVKEKITVLIADDKKKGGKNSERKNHGINCR